MLRRIAFNYAIILFYIIFLITVTSCEFTPELSNEIDYNEEYVDTIDIDLILDDICSNSLDIDTSLADSLVDEEIKKRMYELHFEFDEELLDTDNDQQVKTYV